MAITWNPVQVHGGTASFILKACSASDFVCQEACTLAVSDIQRTPA
jgi:hypothetical protein